MKKARYFFGIILMVAVFGVFIKGRVHAINNEDILISAVNPGFTVDGIQNVGELIELKNLSDDSLLLTGLSIRYVNTSGTEKTIFSFPDGATMTGESLLLRFDKSPETGAADATYQNGAYGIAISGGKIELVVDDKIIDEVCWKSFPGCENKTFNSLKPTTLVRDFETMLFEHDEDYEPDWEEGREVLQIPETPQILEETEETLEPHCRGLRFSEILTFYESSRSEQFIELFNDSSNQINLTGCSVHYKNKTYPLEGIVLPEKYFVRYATDFTLTKNPTNSNTIEIVDVNGEVVDSLTYYNGQKKAMAFAQFGYKKDGSENWLQTYAPTPGEDNNFQKYKTCPEGKVINEETGNCVKATTLTTALEPCPAGSFRNPLTNRCKKYASEASSELKPCAEGYERNPETNRCRKIVSNDGAEYPLAAENFEEKSSFVAIWAIVAVGVLGAFYVIFQYRKEIAGLFKKKV